MSLVILLAAASPQVSPPVISVPPRIAPSAGSATPSNSAVLVVFKPGPVTCAGRQVDGAIARPTSTTTYRMPGQAIAPFVLNFRIGQDGRALGITPAPRAMPGIYFRADDLQPALAASRFASGDARTSCTISYTAEPIPIATAPMDEVYRYLALPHARGILDTAVMKRAREASPNCFGTPQKVLVRAFPDFDAIPQPPGMLSATIVSYDIASSGKPTKVRTLVSDGNVALDAAARKAVSGSRFGRGARNGCTAPFYRRQATPLVPPPTGPMSAFRTNPACDEDGWKWQLPPRMTFPEPFRRRAIEGWAVIRYDVAPWGETGNVTVLASEPAAAFGDEAQRIIRGAKRPASATGATGCVDRVVFKLPEGNVEETTPPVPSPVID